MNSFSLYQLSCKVILIISSLAIQGCLSNHYASQLRLEYNQHSKDIFNSTFEFNQASGNGSTYDGKLVGLHFEAGFTCEGKSSPKSIIEREDGKWFYTENNSTKCQFINKMPISENEVELKLSFNYAIYAKNRYYLKPYLSNSNILCSIESKNKTPYANGDGSSLSPFIICSPQQLLNLSKSASDWSKEFVLGDDLDLASFTDNILTPIGNEQIPFNGKFSGRGFAIYNHTYKSQNENNLGLFGRISKGRVDSLFLVNSNITGLNSVGSLAGIVDNPSSSGGAISMISSCVSIAGSIGGYSSIGGLVGTLKSSVITFSGSDSNLIYGYSDIGGLVGELIEGSITMKSFTFTNVSGVKNIGGLIGVINLPIRSFVSLSFTDSQVYGSESVGGFIGHADSGDVYDSYSKSTVIIRFSDSNRNGGFSTFIGSSGVNAWVYKVYSSGTLIITPEALNLPSGGIVGNSLAPSNIYLSYYSDPVIGNNGIKVSNEDLTHKSTYSTGWGFDTIWSIDEGISPPTLN